MLDESRAAVAAVCRRLVADGLVVGTAGNVSVRSGDLVAVTPTGVGYDVLTAADVGVHDLRGAPVEAPLRPTSEMPLHLAVYAARPDVGAIVHTHPVAGTALSCLVEEVPAVHYHLAFLGGRVVVAPYAPYGTEALAAVATAALADRGACLLGNHGALTVGATLAEAHDRARSLEWICEVALRVVSSGRTPRLLGRDQVDAVAARLATYGQPAPEPG